MKHDNPNIVIEQDAKMSDYQSQLRAYQRALIKKWEWYLSEESGLEPIDKKLWPAMAMLFENQQAVSMRMLEETMTTDVVLPQKYALPIIRKVYPQLIATKIAAVQPMPLASGGVAKAYFLDFKRESDSSSLTTLDSGWALGSENSVPKKLKLTVTSETVTAIKDILGATWSTEVQEDARFSLGIDVEQELISAAADEILREIDQRILGEMLAGASAGNVDWHWTVGSGHTNKEWYGTFGHACIDADNLIYAKRYRSAEWIVLGRTAFGYMAKMSDFKPVDRGDQQATLGVEFVGRLSGMWDVYKTNLISATKGLMGYYPRTWIDTGYIYMPYIPLSPMPLVYAAYDSTTGAYTNVDKWSRNIRTRYGKYLAVSDCYATITISA